MRCSAGIGWPFALLGLLAVGCNQNPFLAAQGPPPGLTAPQQQQSQPLASQLQDSDRRASVLDADNRDLHAAVARAQQERDVARDEAALLRKRLSETTNQLREALSASQAQEKKIETIEASTRRRGGATITANNSKLAPLKVAEIPGFEVRQDGDVIRVEVPADRLFHARTAQLLPNATSVLEPLADAILRNYPNQMVFIEGHTDNTPGIASGNHRLSGDQAFAVLQVFTERNRLPPDQLTVLAYGASQPRVSNATPSGRSKNRRIEVVVYPEAFSRS